MKKRTLLNQKPSFNITAPAGAEVIHLKERSFFMLKKDLILRNPLRVLGKESEDILPKGAFGAVLARAGVGKTSLMVQLALNTLLRSKNVLHISLVDPVKKVDLWYEEAFRNIALQYKLKRTDDLWESILPHRFIMTFKVEGFSVPILEERLTDLTEQGVFFPEMILIDGLPFEPGIRKQLVELKTLAQSYGVHIWFAIKTHRHEERAANGMPIQLDNISDLFDVALFLQPKPQKIHVNILKGGPDTNHQPSLFLDPATMLIKDE
jgi:hypothetical protein